MSSSDNSEFVNPEARKTFRATMCFQKSDFIPSFEALGFWDDTVKRWHAEGLPADQTPWEYFRIDRLMDNTGGFENPSALKRLIDLVFQIPYWPLFETKVIEEKDDYLIKQDEDGVIKKVMKHGVSMPQFLKFPVETRLDWEKIKERLNPESEERYGAIKAMASDLRKRRHILRFGICGSYGFQRNLFGEEKLAYLFYDAPGLLHDVMKHWLCFQTAVADRICPLVDFDYVFLWEDMAFKTAPFISPDIFREFMFPYLKAFIGHVRARHHLDLFMVDSDGNNLALLPLLVEAGINVFMPCEIAAGMEPVSVREKFPNLALLGGIDKRALLKGKKEIEAEIIKKASLLPAGQGYIPSVDHAVPPDVSFENFCYYTKFLRKITGGVF
ncbi:MAG: uroporphyrinogen decarboxylase family protein [Kiritimatiellae bacterium]|nr:uroporphyrinogen decarboxylase family protein [Kiritimatiellia bacterium]